MHLPDRQDRDGIAAFNRHAWNWSADNGNRWTIPVDQAAVEAARAGDPRIILTPKTPVPQSWLGELRDRVVLGLASGGGQQGPLLAAAGARVTIVDLSPRQLERDRACAERFGLEIATIEANADDLAPIGDRSVDLVVNPVSNCFFPRLAPVWRECARVVKPGGALLCGFINPVAYLFDFEKANRGHFELRYRQPFSDLESLSDQEKERFLRPQSPLEFSHSLTEQLGGLMQAGFLLDDLFEDEWDEDHGLNRHFPAFIAVRAVRRGP